MNYSEDIKAYIDGELSPERAEQLRAAIESNSTLREEYEFMKSVSSQIQVSAKVPEVRGFDSAMQAVRPARRFNWRAGIAIAGVAILMTIFAFPYFAQSKDSAKMGSRAGTIAFNTESDDSDVMAMEAPTILGGAASEMFEDSVADEAELSPTEAPNLIRKSSGDQQADSTGENSNDRMMKTLPGAIQIDPNVSFAGAGAPGAGAEGVTKARTSNGLHLIKSANLELHVINLSDAIDETKMFVNFLKGSVESRAAEEGEMKAIWLTLNVPQEAFDSVIDKLRMLGDVNFEKSSQNDVTKSLADNEVLINKLNKEEQMVKAKLANAKTDIETQNASAQLSRIQKELNTLRTRNSVQMKIAATSEINVYLTQKDD